MARCSMLSFAWTASSDRHIPFAFMTGDMESPEGMFHDVPALLKPFTVAELRRALQHLLPE